MSCSKYTTLPLTEDGSDSDESCVPKRRTRPSYKRLLCYNAVFFAILISIVACGMLLTGDMETIFCCFVSSNCTDIYEGNTTGSWVLQTIIGCSCSSFNATFISVLLLGLFGYFVYFVCLFVEERHHKAQRHHNSISKTFQFVFYGRNFVVGCIYTLIICLLVFIVNAIGHCHCLLTLLLVSSIPASVSCFSSCMEPHAIEQSQISESLHGNIGKDKAMWFYIGYLQLVLTDAHESITQRIHQYETGNKVKLASRKLFILFPTSCYTRQNLSSLEFKDSSQKIIEVQKLPQLSIERGGITERVFNNNVYEIRSEGQSYRCVVEYATPLLALHELTERGCSSLSLTKEQRIEQVYIFYRELKFLLRDDDHCFNKFVLVLIKDHDVEYKNGLLLTTLIKKIKEHSVND